MKSTTDISPSSTEQFSNFMSPIAPRVEQNGMARGHAVIDEKVQKCINIFERLKSLKLCPATRNMNTVVLG